MRLVNFFKNWGPAIGLAALIVVMVNIGNVFTSSEDLRSYLFIRDYICDHYVEEVDAAKLSYGAYKGMTDVLDDVSTFYDPRQSKELRESNSGKFGGIGIRYEFDCGTILVKTPMYGTPAYHAGIIAGDRIIEVNNESTIGWTADIAYEKIRGEPGTVISFTIKRIKDAREEVLYKVLTRSIITIPSIRGERMLDNKNHIGYLRISEFKEDTYNEFDAAIQELLAAGMKMIIVDLRENRGGLLSSSLKIANCFIPEGVLLYTVTRAQPPRAHVANASMATLERIPVVVLINGSSASASEILAAALYDRYRGILVGERTYGKGSVQTLIDVPDSDTILKITTDRYYTPKWCSVHKGVRCRHSGKCPHKDNDDKAQLARGGFLPHIEKVIPPDVWSRIYIQMLQDENFIDARKSDPDYKRQLYHERVTDPHLEEALRLLRNPSEYEKVIQETRKNDGRTGN